MSSCQLFKLSMMYLIKIFQEALRTFLGNRPLIHCAQGKVTLKLWQLPSWLKQDTEYQWRKNGKCGGSSEPNTGSAMQIMAMMEHSLK